MILFCALTKASTSCCSREFSKDREVSSSADVSSLKSKSVRFLLSENLLVLLHNFCTAPATLGRTPNFQGTDNMAPNKRALILSPFQENERQRCFVAAFEINHRKFCLKSHVHLSQVYSLMLRLLPGKGFFTLSSRNRPVLVDLERLLLSFSFVAVYTPFILFGFKLYNGV